MVDLVKIRKKARKAAAEQAAGVPETSPASQPIPEAAAPRDESPAIETVTAVAGVAEPPPPIPGQLAATEAAMSKLDRFREQAGRLRDAITPAASLEEKAETDGQSEVLSFVISGEHYAADIEQIIEIVTPRSITRVPNADEAIVGIVSLRGMMVTLVDIRKRLRHDPTAQTAETRIIVVDQHGETLGFEVDRVLRVLKLAAGAVEPHPVVHASEADASILGVFRQEGALTILLDFDKLLATTAART